jgi:hypothetical protein
MSRGLGGFDVVMVVVVVVVVVVVTVMVVVVVCWGGGGWGAGTSGTADARKVVSSFPSSQAPSRFPPLPFRFFAFASR